MTNDRYDYDKPISVAFFSVLVRPLSVSLCHFNLLGDLRLQSAFCTRMCEKDHMMQSSHMLTYEANRLLFTKNELIAYIYTHTKILCAHKSIQTQTHANLIT